MEAREGRRGEVRWKKEAAVVVVPYVPLAFRGIAEDRMDCSPCVLDRGRVDDGVRECPWRWSLDDDVAEGVLELTTFTCFRFSDLSISRRPRIPNPRLARFLRGVDPSLLGEPCDGRVMVLFIASPHRQVWLIARFGSGAEGSGGGASNGTGASESGFSSMSRSRRSWRLLRSCFPVEPLHDAAGGAECTGLCSMGGLTSAVSSVMARSRLRRGSAGSLEDNITGAEVLVAGAGLDSDEPPPSSMRSSAHSQVIRYRELMV